MFEDLKPHLAELRKRLAISVVTVIVMFFVMFAFWQPILDWMIAPLVKVLPEGSTVIFTKVQEPFFTLFYGTKSGIFLWIYRLFTGYFLATVALCRTRTI